MPGFMPTIARQSLFTYSVCGPGRLQERFGFNCCTLPVQEAVPVVALRAFEIPMAMLDAATNNAPLTSDVLGRLQRSVFFPC
eukprot:4001598-Amphidinium_carterae.1